jgi:DNA-directed RNA polymerase subunit M/transcription elongation factor TFIIS
MSKVIKGNHRRMEESRWKKDETPYYLFTCAKCGRWLHVKTTQLNKKCLGCRRNHKVESIKGRSKIVNGSTPAMKKVKELQHYLAQKELGTSPDLRADNDFSIIEKTLNQHATNKSTSTECETNLSYSELLYNALLDVQFKIFPFYMIEMIAEELEISKLELKILLQELITTKILIPLPNQYYRMISRKKMMFIP